MHEYARGGVLGAAVSLWVLLLAAGCSGGDSSRSGASLQLVVTGSSTVAPLMGDLAKQFEAQRPGVRVDVQAGGSSRGIADVRHDLADIGMVSRALGEAEADLSGTQIAFDGVAMIVHASNPLLGLSRDQVIEVYTGRARDWSELGGGRGPITVVHKADGRSTQKVFLDHFALDPGDVDASVVVGGNEQALKSVAGNPGAIGYVSIGAAEASVGLGVPIKLLALDGHAATSEAVAQRRFPIVRELNLVTVGEQSPLAVDFLAFVRSPHAREFIKAHFFVPLD